MGLISKISKHARTIKPAPTHKTKPVASPNSKMAHKTPKPVLKKVALCAAIGGMYCMMRK
jgi:hypothetical protein